VSLNAETGLSADAIVGLESLDTSREEQMDTTGCADETDLHSTNVDAGDRSGDYAESMPSAVLQPSGEFMCSCCGETMKCARAIKRHITTHMTLQLSEPSTTHHFETATNETNDVITNAGTPKRLKKQGCMNKRPENKKDISKQWRSYVCKDCENAFTSSAHLDLHRVQMHRPHQCQKCGAVVIGRRNFSQHVRSEHPGLHICKVLKLAFIF